MSLVKEYRRRIHTGEIDNPVMFIIYTCTKHKSESHQVYFQVACFIGLKIILSQSGLVLFGLLTFLTFLSVGSPGVFGLVD